MLDYSDPARAKALRSSVLFLGHRFPNVRKTTAEALYLKLLANEDIVDEVHSHFGVRVRSTYCCRVSGRVFFVLFSGSFPLSRSLVFRV